MRKLKSYLKFVLPIILISGNYTQISVASEPAEPYDSIVTTGKHWNVLEEFYMRADKSTSIFKIGGDTVVNSVNRKKMLCSTDSAKTWQAVGTIWEIDKEVFYEDTLGKGGSLYDFDVKVGDTVSTVSYHHRLEFNFAVKTIDSVNINGVSRKRIGITDLDWVDSEDTVIVDYWLEGIGSMKGIVSAYPEYESEFLTLLCAYDNNDLIYQDATYNTCYVENGGVGVKSNIVSEVQFSPNPANQSFTVLLPEVERYQIKLFDITGEKVRQKLINKGDAIDISTLKDGVYIVTIEINNSIYQKKLIVTH